MEVTSIRTDLRGEDILHPLFYYIDEKVSTSMTENKLVIESVSELHSTVVSHSF